MSPTATAAADHACFAKWSKENPVIPVLPTLAPDVTALLNGAPALEAAKIAHRNGWATSPNRFPLSPELAKRGAIDAQADADVSRMLAGKLTPAEIDRCLCDLRTLLEAAPGTMRNDRLADESLADFLRKSFLLTRTIAARV